MNIKFLATDVAPDYYTFNGEVVTAHLGDASEEYDLSDFVEGAVFVEADEIAGVPAVLDVSRSGGELFVVLGQAVDAGHWSASDWISPSDYKEDGANVSYNASRPHYGAAMFKAKSGWHAIKEVATNG